MVTIEKTAKSVDLAIDLALAELGVDMDQVDCEVLSVGSKGLFGIGSKDARVRVTYNDPKEALLARKKADSAPTSKETPKFVPKDTASTSEVKKDASKFAPKEMPKEKVASTFEVKKDAPAPKASPNAAKFEKDLTEDFPIDLAFVEKRALDFLTPIFESLGVNPTHEIGVDERVVWISFGGKGLGCVIGRRGETLDALQYLTNLTVNLGLEREKKYRVVLDVEGYRTNRNETLIALAEKMAAKVKKTGRDVVLEPMSPHERRVIHMALQGRPGIKTYSQGEEPYRKVVIAKK